jgi:outer membrane protein
MKKIITILWMPAFLVLNILFVACGNADNKDAHSGNASQSSDTEQKTVETKISDIAYISIDSIFQQYDYYHDLKREFEQKAKKKETEFQSKVSALQADAKSFREKYDKMLFTRSEAEEQGQRLQQREAELNAESQKIMQELSEEEAVMSRKIINAIYQYVEKYNVEKKYALILNAATVVTGNPAMDISSEILKGLNQEYIAQKTSK